MEVSYALTEENEAAYSPMTRQSRFPETTLLYICHHIYGFPFAWTLNVYYICMLSTSYSHFSFNHSYRSGLRSVLSPVSHPYK